MTDEQALRDAIAERGGFITSDDARSAGYTSARIRAAVAARVWRRLYPGVFVDRAWFDVLDAERRHQVHLRARLHVVDAGWCAARRSAAVLHGLPLLGAPPPQPVLVRDRPTLATRGSSRYERFNTLPASEVEEVEGVRCTTLARTVVDIARDESFASGLVVADAALARGVPAEDLRDVAHRCREWPRAPRVLSVLRVADGRSESVMESVSRAGFIREGLPMPELQVEVWHRRLFVARTDFLWRAANVIGEADGRTKYQTVEDLYKEKRREEVLRDLGFEVVRWDWASATHPDRGLAETLERAFERGALNTLAPDVELRTTSLRDAA